MADAPAFPIWLLNPDCLMMIASVIHGSGSDSSSQSHGPSPDNRTIVAARAAHSQSYQDPAALYWDIGWSYQEQTIASVG